MQIEWIDIALLIIIAITFVSGIIRGAILSIISLLVTVVAIYTASILFNGIQDYLEQYIHSEIILNIVSSIIALIFSWATFALLVKPILRVLDCIDLGVINRILGGLFGAIKGVLYASCIMLITVVIVSGSYVGADNMYQVLKKIDNKQFPEWLNNSTSYQLCSSMVDKSDENIPYVSLAYHKEWLEGIDLTADNLSAYDLADDKNIKLDDDQITQEMKKNIINDSISNKPAE